MKTTSAPLSATAAMLLLTCVLALSGCGGGGSGSGSSASSAPAAAAPVSVAGVWWAVNAAPAYALDVNQSGSNLQLGNEQAFINGRTITMTSINGTGTVSTDGTQLQLTWVFPGYGTVHTEYRRINDVVAAASNCELPHHEALALNGGMQVRSFNIGDSEQVYVETSGPVGGDTWLFLFDEHMRMVAEADDPGIDFYAFINRSLNAGTYYVVVTEWNDDLICDLDITLGIGG